MKKMTILLTMLTLAFNAVSAQTIFNFDTTDGAIDNGDNVTQTVDGIGVTVTDNPNIRLRTSTFGGGSGTTIYSTTNTATLTFTFDQAVDVNSILPFDPFVGNVDFTFTPTPAGGSNTPVTVSLVGGLAPGSAPVALNWTNVTSFTVTTNSSTNAWGFDDLSVRAIPPAAIFNFDTTDGAVDNGDNVTQTIDGIGVTVTDNPNIRLRTSTFGGGSGTTIYSTTNTATLTFTFDQAVDVNSILPFDPFVGNVDFTFTPTPAGGSNTPVTVSLVGGLAPGSAPVALNWTNVTSFTVTTNSSTNAWGFDDLSVRAIPPAAIFNFDTTDGAVDNGDNVTQTIDGIGVTVTDNPNIRLRTSTFGGGSGTTIYSTTNTATLTFTFDQAVDVNSILPFDPFTENVDFTFTPTPSGGSNTPVIVSLVGGLAPGSAPVALNWTNVTSFTVTTNSSTNAWGFDDLSVSSSITLSVTDDYIVQKAKVYPNPVENVLHIKNISDLKSVDVYNNLGQLILQTKQNTIDVSHLSKGIYILKIRAGQVTETKKIIKK